MENKKKVLVVTHNSGFHTDDVFATATLSIFLEREGIDFEIVRTRDHKIIESADYVMDVGGISDPEKNRFDHHQEGKAGERSNGIPYASFGLVWKKFGPILTGSTVISESIDKMLVQPIDALDNGVKIIKSEIDGVMPVDIGLMTFLFYPTWREQEGDIDKIFIQMVSYAKFLLLRVIKYKTDEFDAEKFVIDAYNNAEDKRLIIVENNKYPWNKVLTRYPEPLFVIYKNIANDTWNMKGIMDDFSSFVYRKYLPKEWSGKRDFELEKITGVSGSVFCHNDCFIAVNKTKEGILKMAEIALNS